MDEPRSDEPQPGGQRSDGQRSDGQRSAGQRSAGQRSGGRGPDEPLPGERLPGTLSEADRRRLDAVFGDVLPATTSDERGPEAAPRDPDADLLADRPPHHDRGS